MINAVTKGLTQKPAVIKGGPPVTRSRAFALWLALLVWILKELNNVLRYRRKKNTSRELGMIRWSNQVWLAVFQKLRFEKHTTHSVLV